MSFIIPIFVPVYISSFCGSLYYRLSIFSCVLNSMSIVEKSPIPILFWTLFFALKKITLFQTGILLPYNNTLDKVLL